MAYFDIFLTALISLTAGAAFFSLVIAFLFNCKGIKKVFSKVKRNAWIALLIIFIIGLLLNSLLSPRIHIDVGNEVDYLETGKNILLKGRGVQTSSHADGRETKSFHPMGWAFIIALTYLFTGISAGSAFFVSTLLTTLGVIAMFMLTYLMFKNETTALLSSLIFTLVPGIIIYSGTIQPNASSLLFILITLFSFYFMLRENSIRSKLLFASSLAFLLYYRQEFVLFFLLFAFMALIHKKETMFRVDRNHVIVTVIFLLLISPQILEIFARQDADPLIRVGPETMGSNLSHVMSPFYLSEIAHPIILTVLMLIGIVYILYRRPTERKMIYSLSMYMIIFSAFFIFPDYVLLRMLLVLYIPMSILAAKGFGPFEVFRSYRKYAMIIVLVLLIASFIPFAGKINRNTRIMSGVGNEVSFEINSLQTRMEIELSANNPIPKECPVMIGKPKVFGFLPGVRTHSLMFAEDVENLKDEYGCLFVLKDWCYYSNDRTCGNTTDIIDMLIETYDTEPYLTFNSENLEYVFYEIGDMK